METTKDAKGEPADMKLEVVVLGVSNGDRAKTFYESSDGDSMPISQKAMISVLFSSHHTIPDARSSLEWD